MIRKYNNPPTPQMDGLKDVIAAKDRKILIYGTAAALLAVVCTALIVAILVVASYPKSQGYVIEIAPDGSASMNSDAITLLEKWDAKEQTIQHFLGEFITELRTVSSDAQIVTTNIDKLYRRVTGNAADAATKWLKETNPKSRLKSETVTVKIASILPLSDRTYQIDFRETVWSSSRTLKSDKHYRCVAHTQIYIPRTKEQATYNPIGLYVTDYTITEVREI